MRVIIVKDYAELSREAAAIVKHSLQQKPSLVLGLVGGSTPLGTYQELVRLHKEEGLSFSRAFAFGLDEYVGLGPDHPQSFHYFLHHNLLDHIDIPKDNIYLPDGTATNLEQHCRWLEDQMERLGGIDLEILGIGRSGHIGFNEPGSSLASRTRVKTLDEQTITDNSRFFGSRENIPRSAITMGIGTILEAKKIILLASGETKAGIIAQAIEGPVTNQTTASILQIHPHTIVILDEAAASLLERKDYYLYAEEQRRRFEKGFPL